MVCKQNVNWKTCSGNCGDVGAGLRIELDVVETGSEGLECESSGSGYGEMTCFHDCGHEHSGA
jgi:hypothetical protein